MFDICKYLTQHDEVGVLPLLMCKDNFVVDPSLWLEYATNEANLTFDTFVERKLT